MEGKNRKAEASSEEDANENEEDETSLILRRRETEEVSHFLDVVSKPSSQAALIDWVLVKFVIQKNRGLLQKVFVGQPIEVETGLLVKFNLLIITDPTSLTKAKALFEMMKWSTSYLLLYWRKVENSRSQCLLQFWLKTDLRVA